MSHQLFASAKQMIRPVARRFVRRIHLDRVVLNRELERIALSLPLGDMEALEISGSAWKERGFRSYRHVQYPEFDVCEEPLPDRFDFIVAEQVFEHLLWPYRAGRNVLEMLRPGGYFLLSTPFLQKVHGSPSDCSRWTETGMKHFLAECGFPFDSISTGSWGNKTAARANLRRRGHPIYSPIMHRNLENDPLFTVQVWALARKGQASDAVDRRGDPEAG